MRIVLSVLLAIPLAACATTTPSAPGGDDDGDDVPPLPGQADAGAIDPPGPTPDASPPVDPVADAAPPAPPDAAPTIADLCFAGLGDPNKPRPNYDQFGPIPGSHCAGTNHQDITDIEKVVFLGDSITEGTPPTLPLQYYRDVLTLQLRNRFGWGIEVVECSAWGARTDDLLEPPHQQIHECFPGPEPKRTLVIMTVGGNDMSSIVEDALAGDTEAQTIAKVDDMLLLLRNAITYLKDPMNFPAGSFVVFANMYEFTDATGDTASCPGAALAGFGGDAPAVRPAYIHANEQYMHIAVDTGTDMIFLLENFCGHGFHAGEPANECFRGLDAETWFDLTCIHPNPTGHGKIAEFFYATVAE